MFANGLTYLAIPGPSVMPERVLRAMHRPAPNIYTGELHELTHGLVPDLKAVAGTAHNVAIYIANGHGVWEAALSNVIGPGDTVLVLATGRFCVGWGEMAEALGATVQTIDFGDSDAVDLAKLKAALQADKDGKIKAVLTVQVDTSTGVLNDVKGMRGVLDAVGHDALLMCDCIASLGCDAYHMDEWGVDVMIAASQKGLMTPPGIGFVFFGPKAQLARDVYQLAKHEKWIDAKDRIAAYKLYADLRGFIEKPGTTVNNNTLVDRRSVMVVTDHGTDEEWEAKLRAQQAALTHDATPIAVN